MAATSSCERPFMENPEKSTHYPNEWKIPILNEVQKKKRAYATERWMGSRTVPATPGFESEYMHSYDWKQHYQDELCRNVQPPGLVIGRKELDIPDAREPEYQFDLPSGFSDFHSSIYPSVYRETVLHKDDRGRYIDPFRDVISKPDGRRYMYDQSHPHLIYESQWTSDLQGIPGPYSYPTPTGLPPEIPFRRQIKWRQDGEVGEWPTEAWKTWTQVARCPTYDGYDTNVEMAKCANQVPGLEYVSP